MTAEWVGVRTRIRDFSLLHVVLTGSGAHPGSCIVSTGRLFHQARASAAPVLLAPTSTELRTGGDVLSHTLLSVLLN